MSHFHNSCEGCGLSVHDLPIEELELDPEDALEAFFEYADDGSLYCKGCVQSGMGVFL